MSQPLKHQHNMNPILRNTCTVLALTLAVSAGAQNLNSAYFLEGYTYGHELNPAKKYDHKGYFSFPLMGNLNLGTRGNLALQDILYKNPNGSGLVTYLHPSISAEKAMDAFSRRNKILSDVRLTLASVGFSTRQAYHTISLTMRSNAGINIPYDFFDITKNLQNKNYDFSSLGATTKAWMELGYGQSRQINEEWRVGAKAKWLVGLGRVNVKADNLSLRLADENQWTANAKATVEISAPGITWGETKTVTDPSGRTYEEIDFDKMDAGNVKPHGMGLALDLGAEWDMDRLVPGLKTSASLLDFGFISWGKTLVARNAGEPFVFNGFQNVQVSGGPGTPIDDQYDNLADDFERLYRLEAAPTRSAKTTMLGATLNLAAEYQLPAYDRLRFGLLSTTRIQGRYSWHEERLSATISPCRAFEASASLGLGTTGATFGWVVNIHPKGFNLFLGMDRMLGKLSKQGIPLRSNADFTLGINFPIGTKR